MTDTSPSIEMAKQGKVGPAFDFTVPVTERDAIRVPFNASEAYRKNFSSAIGVVNELCYFASLEQAECMQILLGQAYPGSVLVVEDNPNNLAHPGYDRIQYTNSGKLFEPRMYKITGTLRFDGEDLPADFYVGYHVNVIRLKEGGTFEAQALGYPFGNTLLRATNYFGTARPAWVGGEKKQ